MAVSNISLTAGMRSNLTSLQGTVDLLNRTQERLSTGMKVNTALDNATAFFTAKAHRTAASELADLKDTMSEGIQTIKKADGGVSGISDLIASAKALAIKAKATEEAGSLTGKTETVNITTNLEDGDVITVGGDSYEAVTVDTMAGDGSTEFLVGTTASETAQNLADIVNTETQTDNFEAEVNGDVVTLRADDLAVLVAGDVDVTGVVGGEVTETIATESSGRFALSQQYDEVISQIQDLVADSSYAGVNLLNGTTEELIIDFGNNHGLTIAGFDGAGGLTESTATEADWGALTGYVANVNTDISELDTAKDALEVGSQNLSNYLNIVTIRQDWSQNTMNVLTEGADTLTLADSNEEAANMLMLQTRQALGTTALSLSSQAAQSVLRLF